VVDSPGVDSPGASAFGRLAAVCRCVASGALLCAMACGGAVGSGKSPKAGNSATDSGATPSADAGRTAAKTGDAGPPPMSKRQACLAYLRAQQNRTNECEGLAPFDDSQLPFYDQCPDLVFADGSTRTIEGTLACAETWKTFPCEDLRNDRWPACSVGGTRTPGMSCLFRAQCQSDECNATGTSCGTCKMLAAKDGDCSDQNDVACPMGQHCASSRCVDSMTSPLRDAGASCTASTDCKPGLHCFEQSSSMSACEPLPPAGQACAKIASSLFCADPARCNASLVCQTPPQSGEACAMPGDTSTGTPFCTTGAYCNPEHVCARLPGAGEACAKNASGVGNLCSTDTLCAQGMCGPRLGPGEACHPVRGNDRFQGDCTSGLFCSCDDTSCTTGSCLTVLPEGASCGARNSRCENGTACLTGTCVAPDSLGLFMQRCAGK